jgi:hypothetical protein
MAEEKRNVVLRPYVCRIHRFVPHAPLMFLQDRILSEQYTPYLSSTCADLQHAGARAGVAERHVGH